MLKFTPRAWNDYQTWQDLDRRYLKKINQLLTDIQRQPFEGLGKPEPLRGNLSGWWSRRIDEEHRLVYRIDENRHIEILQCRGHYQDR